MITTQKVNPYILSQIEKYKQNYPKRLHQLLDQFLSYAAIPVALNSELLHLIRINFFLDPPNNLPYIVESDLLLSTLCENLGDSLYEINSEIRDYLLKELSSNQSKKQEINEVATLLWQYTQRSKAWLNNMELDRAQKLTALNLLDKVKAKNWLDEKENELTSQSTSNKHWFIAMRKELKKHDKPIIVPSTIPEDKSPNFLQPEFLENNSHYSSISMQLQTAYELEDISHIVRALKELDKTISKLLTPTELQKWRNKNSRFIHLLRIGVAIWNSWRAENEKETVDLSNYDLSKYNFNLNFINFSNVNLKEANLSGVDLTKAQLNNADLSGTILNTTKLNSANLNNAKLVKVQLKGNNILYGDFSGADFTEADLTDTVLTNLNLDEADFTNAILVNTKFINCTLAKANFKGSVWDNTLLSDCYLFNVINIENINHNNISILQFSKPTSINELHPNFLKYCLILQPFTFTTVRLNIKGQVTNKYTKQGTQFIEDLGNGIKLEMIQIPSGEFMMGTNESDVENLKKECKRYGWSEDWIKTELPQHKVRVGAFFIGKYQVTQEQWKEIMGNNPSYFKGESKLPVENVSWNQAIEFCKRLSEKTNKMYRLPSEAEWEYAARAGTTTAFAFGETINTEIVNYNGNRPYGEVVKGEYRAKTIAVGSLGVANEFGVYDMHGNVWEWCQDLWHDNYNNAPTDGSAWESNISKNTDRVLRGGYFSLYAILCRSAYRNWLAPDVSDDYGGFRVVCEIARTLK